ncbi:hypothetical protein EDD70_0800 [Hydrogenoanaerobacterium saccharovorans]|uniref:Uncharacterized protein n=1 Tax=Hydrogenoanaerobacterium saccharovorans TaxID=474960 RepID=A0A1H8AED2_9FIRM|nr:hypothetical protein [Hydrogenoanaerobacterium saccharovorans]RPF47991.1 hypothetical protein EDD70_0800 [Hydrogenoanaerobacterium saccharovorans]SEM69090.1 hypothetical protein SAMN05216180_1291 [Hydrogenoanaerobacterium saccharovorans]
MENELSQQILVYKKKMKLQFASYIVIAFIGAGLLAWWLTSHYNGLFDIYQAYIVGVSAGLFIYGTGSSVKMALLLKNRDKLAATAAEKLGRTTDSINDKAMAAAFKIFLSVMMVALIFIGNMFNFTSFVVCLFTVVFAYLCYIFTWVFMKKAK